jgi:DNA-binding NarL/FixJ family response regulator
VIARERSRSEDTVKQHLSAVYQLLGVHNRTEAVYTLSQRSLRIA